MARTTIDEFLASLHPCATPVRISTWDSSRFFVNQLAAQSYLATTGQHGTDKPHTLHIRLGGEGVFATGEVFGTNCIAVSTRINDITYHFVLQRLLDEEKGLDITPEVRLHARKRDWEVTAVAVTELFAPYDADIPMIAKLITEPEFKPQEA